MDRQLLGFRAFVEDQTRSAKKKPKENYVDGLSRELGIDPNSLPDTFVSGPVQVDDLFFNQAIWDLVKPIDPADRLVRVRLHPTNSPNLNQHCYRKGPDGSMQPVQDVNLVGRTFLITMNKLGEMLGRGWQTSQAAPFPV